jgi:hypothetical protein
LPGEVDGSRIAATLPLSSCYAARHLSAGGRTPWHCCRPLAYPLHRDDLLKLNTFNGTPLLVPRISLQEPPVPIDYAHPFHRRTALVCLSLPLGGPYVV